MSGPLAGFRVIEFAGVGPGPFCAMMLSDLGADVVRVDRPAAPDASDGNGTEGTGGMASVTDGIMGRGRRSIALDLKRPEGLATALDLVAGADALIESFRPGVMERLGLGPEVCLERNPRLVYGRVTGWGQEGPYARVAGHDLNFLALAGALAPLGRRALPPAPPLNIVGDFGGGGMLIMSGLLAGLLETSRSGRGQVVDAAMIDGVAYQMAMPYELLGRGVWVEERESNVNDGGSHFYDVYETADGEYVALAAMEDRFYADLLERLGLAGRLPAQWDREGWPTATKAIADVIRTRTRDEWCEALEGTDACFSPVLRMSEAPAHPHHVAREAFVEVDGVVQPAPAPRFSRTPGAVARPRSRPGEHTAEILGELGLTDERIAELGAAGAFG
ncbi:CaiB/BaiF CoA transferase family protein [Pseudonocardia sp. RS010]|uniref:CaiB/BaiF CoA transferase family protein n=1 Tax=Pseudonocardia sp. RS010 TaxID=3385979 RepID=UPI00399FA763